MKNYIEYAVIILLRLMLNLLCIFPIKKNRIVFYSFNGKQYSCNPKKISDYLREKDSRGIEIIWAFKKPGRFKSYIPKTIKIVKYRSLLFYYYVKTARVVVFNVQGYGEISRRQNQIFIQTWHASNGYKKVGAYKGIKRKKYLLGHRDYSYVLCGSRNMEEQRVRGSMGFKGEVFRGTPRMDHIINQDRPDLRSIVFSKIGISQEKKLVLYAPTWRDNRKENNYGIEYEDVKKALEKRFGGEWIIAVRLHPNVCTQVNTSLSYVVDVTQYQDMDELIYVSDALISDYSSCIWDFSFTYRPCFLFCSDLVKYEDQRDFDMPIETWGFPWATSMQGLCELIEKYDREKYIKSINKHHRTMGSYEDGHATARICSLIICSMKREVCNEEI